jgi:hypothetical protein
MGISSHDLLGACLALTALRHLSFDDADDGHENRASSPAAPDIGEDALQIHSSAAGSCRTHEGLQDGAAESAADNSAIEFPTAPRLFSFMAAPATLPPTAPLTASIIRLVMSMVYLSSLLVAVF